MIIITVGAPEDMKLRGPNTFKRDGSGAQAFQRDGLQVMQLSGVCGVNSQDPRHERFSFGKGHASRQESRKAGGGFGEFERRNIEF
jgi:hypothetical protein